MNEIENENGEIKRNKQGVEPLKEERGTWKSKGEEDSWNVRER